MRTSWVVLSLSVFATGTLCSWAAAIDKTRECKPTGMPQSVGEIGGVLVAQPVDYWNESWLLIADKAVKPDRIRLLGADGKLVELGKPPITAEPQFWLARGRAVYALAKGRSQTAGKTDVVLMRWGNDPRPRMTILHTADSVEGQIVGAFSNEFLAVTWAEKGKDGKPHRMVSFLDSEELRVAEPQDLGGDSGASARVVPVGKSFVLVWSSGAGLMRASFDWRGKPANPSQSAAWARTLPVRALSQCGEQLWVVQDSGKDLALSVGPLTGPLKEVAHLPSVPAGDALPVYCVDQNLALARRVLSAKGDNITLWISTVDTAGKVRERRVKDIKGGADDIRLPQLGATGGKLKAWWAEGMDGATKVWSRELSCD